MTATHRLPLPLLVLTLVTLAAWLPQAQAQEPAAPEVAAAVADQAVRDWLDSSPPSVAALADLPAAELCRELPALFTAPPPPAGTEVEFDDRRERDTTSPNRARFTYAAETPPNRLDVVEVRLVRDGPEDAWRVERVGFQAEEGGGRPWLQTREAGIGFALLSLLLVYGFLRPSPLRRWLSAGTEAVRAHRRLVAFTMIGGWTLVAVGLTTGSGLPDECGEAVLTILDDTLRQVGAVQALMSGDVLRTAAVIFYQNFVVVSVTALFGSALLLGLPAYLLAGVSFFVQTVAFGTLGLGSGVGLVLTLILLVIEFTAYFLVVAGGGMVLVGLLRGGFAGLGTGYRRLVAVMSIVALLLLVGAWYEAVILLL